MPIIDADTHVDETEATWAYLKSGEEQFRPETAYPKDQDPSRPPMRYWVIDGKRHLRFIRNDEQTQTTVQTRELIDVDARLRDMDRMGVDVQVMYPTLSLVEVTERPELIEANAGRLVGTESGCVVNEASRLLSNPAAYDEMVAAENPFGDGHAAQRIVDILARSL